MPIAAIIPPIAYFAYQKIKIPEETRMSGVQTFIL